MTTEQDRDGRVYGTCHSSLASSPSAFFFCTCTVTKTLLSTCETIGYIKVHSCRERVKIASVGYRQFWAMRGCTPKES